ncbi:MAG: hypothetical protein RL316_1126 [Bacteroidota bacterium]|jgi:hypothetical protein
MAYAVSTIYGEGQKFYESINQGSMYMEVSYTNPLKFDPNFTITTPRDEAFVEPTVSNYAAPAHDYFMGNFTGFWVHKIYRDGHLVYTTQGVNQDLFIPIQYDSIQSVSLNVSESIPYDGPVRPPVPAPGVGVMLGLAALCVWGRKRFN